MRYALARCRCFARCERRRTVAAFLNAAFGYCLGCEMYLLLRRVT